MFLRSLVLFQSFGEESSPSQASVPTEKVKVMDKVKIMDKVKVNDKVRVKVKVKDDDAFCLRSDKPRGGDE